MNIQTISLNSNTWLLKCEAQGFTYMFKVNKELVINFLAIASNLTLRHLVNFLLKEMKPEAKIPTNP